jgi:hypothetical protein
VLLDSLGVSIYQINSDSFAPLRVFLSASQPFFLMVWSSLGSLHSRIGRQHRGSPNPNNASRFSERPALCLYFEYRRAFSQSAGTRPFFIERQ